VELVSWDQLSTVCEEVGSYLSIPIALILGALGFLLYARDIKSNFRQTYDMRRLRDKEVVNWPQIMPVAALDLVKQDLDIGPWSMSVQPKQFARRYQLLKEDKDNPNNIIYVKGRPVGKTMIIDRLAAARLFLQQMGPYWRGPESLPIHTRALFAVFIARINHDVASATDLLMQIGRSTTQKALDFSGVDALVAKYKDTKMVQKISQRHGYVLTVMPSFLELARSDGVLSTADFLWLKPIDRPLWYVLNNVGRPSIFTEVAGPMAHWFSELEYGRPLFVPTINEAVNALEVAIKEILFKMDSADEDDGDAFSSATESDMA
jgi:intracellular multiplication protein IcmP